MPTPDFKQPFRDGESAAVWVHTETGAYRVTFLRHDDGQFGEPTFHPAPHANRERDQLAFDAAAWRDQNTVTLAALFMYDVERVREAAREAGIPDEYFAEWEGFELGLYRSLPHVSAGGPTPPRDDSFTLDLGHAQRGLTRDQATAFGHRLKQRGISFSQRRQYDAWSARTKKT